MKTTDQTPEIITVFALIKGSTLFLKDGSTIELEGYALSGETEYQWFTIRHLKNSLKYSLLKDGRTSGIKGVKADGEEGDR